MPALVIYIRFLRPKHDISGGLLTWRNLCNCLPGTLQLMPHVPLAFYKAPSLSPCGPLHTAVIVRPADSAGSIQCEPYIEALSYAFALAHNCTVQIQKATEERYTQSKHNTRDTVAGWRTSKRTTQKGKGGSEG